MIPEIMNVPQESIYAGFWRRFGAFWLDMLIQSPWIILIGYINNEARLNVCYTIVPSYLFFVMYHIYCVQRWGGTPGKLITKIRIVKLDGTAVSWKEAWLRHAVDLLLGLPGLIALMIVVSGMSDEKYLSMDYITKAQWIQENAPSWNNPVSMTHQVWVWGEFIVLLCNKKRRALHDFIAGTVVMKSRFVKNTETRDLH